MPVHIGASFYGKNTPRKASLAGRKAHNQESEKEKKAIERAVTTVSSSKTVTENHARY